MQTYLLLCPNLTMAALAATALLSAGSRDAATWVVLSGLFLTVISLLLLPRAIGEKRKPVAALPENQN